MRISLLFLGIQTALVIFGLGCSGSGDGTGGAGGATSTTVTSGKTSVTSTTTTVATTTTSQSTTTSTGGGIPTVSLGLDNATIAAGATAQGTVTVMNFVLEPPSATNKPGHGHYHVYLDGASGGSYLVANQVPTVPIKIPAATAAGPHTLRISLSSNDHVPLAPAVEEVIDITVQ